MRKNTDRFRTNFGSRKAFHVGLFFKMIIAISVISFAVNISACSANDSPFPEIPKTTADNSSTTSPSSETSSTESYQYPIIKLAAPVSTETTDYLVKLYEAKKAGLLGDGITGLNVSLEFLDSIETTFGVDVYTTSSTGASVESYDNWDQSGTVPDIILSDSLSQLAEDNKIIPLNDLLADNQLLLPSNTYINFLNNLAINNKQYGIPYSASVEVLFVNNEVLSTAGIPQMSFETDLATINNISEAVALLNNEDTLPENRVLPFYQVRALIPYLPSSYDPVSGYFMFSNGIPDFKNESFKKSLMFLREYLSKGYSVDGLTEEEIFESFGTLDPILAKRVAMWVGNSEEISRWANYMPYTISIVQIPSVLPGEYSPSAITVYPLCISSQSVHQKLAVDFASFIALDRDAVLLRLRLEKEEGFIPVIRESAVWEYAFSELKFSSSLFKLREQIDTAYFSPAISDHQTYFETVSLLARYSDKLLNSEFDLDALLNELTADYSE